MVQIPFKFSPRSIPPQFITVHCGECFFNRDMIYREFRIYLFTYSLGTYFLFVIFSPREIIISLVRRSPIRTRFGWKRGVLGGGKFRPIHSDDWKETGQENQTSVTGHAILLFTAFRPAPLRAYRNKRHWAPTLRDDTLFSLELSSHRSRYVFRNGNSFRFISLYTCVQLL